MGFKMILSNLDHKRLGDHLLEAGLITSFQLEVVMQDQEATGMRFGEILVARGWVKEEILEDLANRLTAENAKSDRLRESQE